MFLLSGLLWLGLFLESPKRWSCCLTSPTLQWFAIEYIKSSILCWKTLQNGVWSWVWPLFLLQFQTLEAPHIWLLTHATLVLQLSESLTRWHLYLFGYKYSSIWKRVQSYSIWSLADNWGLYKLFWIHSSGADRRQQKNLQHLKCSQIILTPPPNGGRGKKEIFQDGASAWRRSFFAHHAHPLSKNMYSLLIVSVWNTLKRYMTG